MPPESAPEIPSVTVAEASTRHQAGARLIDVREPVEWEAAHIPGSVLKPMSTINDWYAELDQDEELLVVCRSGSRSGSVVDALINKAGFTNAHNVSGGIIAWAEADLPIES